MKTPGTIEVSEADYRRQRKAYKAMLKTLKTVRGYLEASLEGGQAWDPAAAELEDVEAAIKLAEEGD